MKKKHIFIKTFFLAALFNFVACDDDTDLASSDVPKAVEQTFNNMFANVHPQWELENKLYKAEFFQDGHEMEACFNSDGSWSHTYKDVYINELPEPVTNYVSTKYADYRIDESKFVKTPTTEYYQLELERNGKRDRILRLSATGEEM